MGGLEHAPEGASSAVDWVPGDASRNPEFLFTEGPSRALGLLGTDSAAMDIDSALSDASIDASVAINPKDHAKAFAILAGMLGTAVERTVSNTRGQPGNVVAAMFKFEVARTIHSFLTKTAEGYKITLSSASGEIISKLASKMDEKPAVTAGNATVAEKGSTAISGATAALDNAPPLSPPPANKKEAPANLGSGLMAQNAREALEARQTGSARNEEYANLEPN